MQGTSFDQHRRERDRRQQWGNPREQDHAQDPYGAHFQPQNREAETHVLGSIQIDPACMAQVADILEPQDFYIEEHRLIYAALFDLWTERKPIDLTTLCDRLAAAHHLELVGGASYVSSLANGVPTSANVGAYVAIVARCALLRRLIQAAGEIAQVAYTAEDAEQAVEFAQIALLNATIRHIGSMEGVPFDTAVYTFLDEMAERVEAGRMLGVLTGYPALDQHLMGLLPGELVYLCGRPGMGKSAFAAAFALNIALAAEAENADRATVEWVSLEMSHTQQVKRLVAGAARINSRVLRAAFRQADGSVNQPLYQAMRAEALTLAQAVKQRLILHDRAMTMEQLCAYARRVAARRGLKLLVVDYLGLLETDEATQSDYQRIGKMSRMLKGLALDLGIPILCLVQLNRKCEDRANKRPELGDLRDSGQLEQDADVVIGVYRDAYYHPDSPDPNYQQFAELLVLKAREGVANAMIPMRFISEYTRPEDWPADVSYHAYTLSGASGGAGEAEAGQPRNARNGSTGISDAGSSGSRHKRRTTSAYGYSDDDNE